MKLCQLKIRNFRSYKEEFSINFENLTAFIGKNDVGKSTILEALEIFFNNKCVACENEDLCVSHNENDNEIDITCIFSNLPKEIVLDSSAKTSLKDEYLLNNENLLEIKKTFKCTGAKPKVSTYIICNHPSNENCNDLLLLKLSTLKKKAKELEIDEKAYIATTSSSIRKAIWNSTENLSLKIQQLPIDKEGAKEIYSSLEPFLPMFALFQSDRSSSDSDKEISNPMSIAISKALKELETEITRIKTEVQKRALETANKTLEKLKEMNSSLADSLLPEFKSEPKFDSLFKLTIKSDDGISINKRGSGVRRLILLNFFRAEAERQLNTNKKNNVIYAFEEPETSQHPSHQLILIKAFLKLSEKPNCQIILTTHTPALCELIPLESLRLVKNESGINKVLSKDDSIYKEISTNLGILPEFISNSSKKIVLVEGKDDVLFFKHLNSELKKAGEITKTFDELNIAVVPTGGCDNLKYWITKELVQKFGLPWAIFIDSDKTKEDDNTKNMKLVEKYKAINNCCAFVTKKREIENYLHPDLFTSPFPIEDYNDIKKIIRKDVFKKNWKKMSFEQIRERETYTDNRGNVHYELTETINDIISLVKE